MGSYYPSSEIQPKRPLMICYTTKVHKNILSTKQLHVNLNIFNNGLFKYSIPIFNQITLRWSAVNAKAHNSVLFTRTLVPNSSPNPQ